MSIERTCVICKTKAKKDLLFRFNIYHNEIVIDINHNLNSYGYYFCRSKDCESFLQKWFKKRKNIKSLKLKD